MPKDLSEELRAQDSGKDVGKILLVDIDNTLRFKYNNNIQFNNPYKLKNISGFSKLLFGQIK